MQSEARYVQVARRRVRYREAGAGAAVMLVHGLGLSSDFWRKNYAAFAGAGLRAVAPDLPGFGRTRGAATGLNVEQTADWLIAFADALGLERPAWVGHSIACQPVMDLAARYPHRAAALVLAAPTGAPVRHRALHQLRALTRAALSEPIELLLAVAREYVRTSPIAYAGTWWRALRDQPIEKAPRVRCPTLLVLGTTDPIVPAEYVELLLRRIPDARSTRVAGGAHGIVFDAAGGFNRVAVDFLRAAVVRPGPR